MTDLMGHRCSEDGVLLTPGEMASVDRASIAGGVLGVDMMDRSRAER
jgi:hypothetical protein